VNIERGVYLRLIRWEEVVENGGIGKILNAHLVSAFPSPNLANILEKC